jgi:protein-S-isoprenylcysteine O-methyltransferase Ste14
MSRTLALLYGAASYLVFVASFVYAIGFVGNLLVPKSIDSGVIGPVGIAFAVDCLLIGLFAVQHSVMARRSFKRWWTRFVPVPVERSTYVLTSSLLLGAIFWQWRPMPSVIWRVADPVSRFSVHAGFWAGWALVLISTLLIDHFDLFGLRHVYLYFSDRTYSPIEFKAALLYRWVRHPIMLGFLLAFWATPMMTLGHLLFAAAMTAYVLVALRFEERDLVSFYGERYEDYKRRVGMLLPRAPKP